MRQAPAAGPERRADGAEVTGARATPSAAPPAAAAPDEPCTVDFLTQQVLPGRPASFVVESAHQEFTVTTRIARKQPPGSAKAFEFPEDFDVWEDGAPGVKHTFTVPADASTGDMLTISVDTPDGFCIEPDYPLVD